MAALGLGCCAGFLLLCRAGQLFVAVCGLLIAVASLVVEAQVLGVWASVVVVHRLSSCGSQAQLLCSMWDLPGSAIEPMSTALAGGFLTIVPPGKSQCTHFIDNN